MAPPRLPAYDGGCVKKILVVEDDPLNAQILADYLEANGYQPVIACNGVEGVERFRAERPDLMLVDVQLPRKNGYEVCFEVKGTPEGARMPLLLMSAVYTNAEHARPYTERGMRAEGYLVKPFELRDLLAQVQQLIGAATQ
jgi:DNA-binding response OmpR family regulator